METVDVTHGQLRVIKIPGDGNCLFSSLCSQLFQLEVGSVQHKEKVRGLREEVSNFIFTHAWEDRYRNCIVCRIAEEMPHWVNLNYSSQVRKFIDFLSTDGNWGGEETIMAVSNMYMANITIHYEKGSRITIPPHGQNPIRSLNIVYRLQNKYSNIYQYNHYDSLAETHTPQTNENIAAKRKLPKTLTPVIQDKPSIKSPRVEPVTPRVEPTTPRVGKVSSIHTRAAKPTPPKETNLISPAPVLNSSQSTLLTQALPSFNSLKSYNSDIQHLQSAAQVNQPTIFYLTPKEEKRNKMQQITENIMVASWNVRGCNQAIKRDEIDHILTKTKIDLACLQETKLTPGTANTDNFNWHLFGDNSQNSTHRGIAILISKSFPSSLFKIKKVSENIAACHFDVKGETIQIINVYIPGDKRGATEFNNLGAHLITQKTNNNTIIMGDFNAHVGTKDITASDTDLIGKNLFHDKNNDNGTDLKNLLHLTRFRLRNSLSNSKTLKTTWKAGALESQIDHVLTAPKNVMNCTNLKAIWTNVRTDHKLVIVTLKQMSKNPNKTPPASKTCTSKATVSSNRSSNKISQKSLKWNTQNLKDEQTRLYYKINLDCRLKTQGTNSISSPPAELWDSMKECIKETADTVLNRPTSPMTPKRRKANAKFQQAKFRSERDPRNNILKKELSKARKEKGDSIQAHIHDQCENFFQNLNSHHPAERVQKTFKFLAKYKRQSTQVQNKTFIPISHWHNDIKLASVDDKVKMLPELKGVVMANPPNPDEVSEYVQNLRNNTAPGNDRLNIELIKYGPPSLFNKLCELISNVWESNQIPPEWTETTQIPIPKKKSPKSISDYRKITLCNTIYKVYAKFLLDKLLEHIKAMPLYQAGFQKNRSTDDQIFIARSVLDERWRKGKTTYILSIDLKQAFDRLKLEHISAILQHKGVPNYLINRILAACLTEKTCIQWFGRKTDSVNKTRGVKQGCPLSPIIFTIALNAVIETVVEVLGNYNIQGENMNPPMILAYADDVIVISENALELERFLQEFIPTAESIGLELNISKSEVLVRDPYDRQHQLQQGGSIRLCNMDIKLVEKMKYLGVYLTNNINRPATVRERIKSAFRICHSIVPFFTKNKLSFNLIRTMYHAVITPVITYGLKSAALTKRNRTSLRRAESQLICMLARISRDKPISKCSKFLLDNKTILKKISWYRLRYAGHIARREADHILQNALKYEIAGKKKHGRPCLTWKDSFKEEMYKLGLEDLTEKPDWFDKASIENLKRDIFDATLVEEED